ncbi:MAG: 4-hydroxybenzoate octaprenyltransferase [Gammaproteobacteria bacterium]|nr:4-hydroxybenzoate octaprenyltransferase [Gammaproteobacteria bacterium]
MAAPPPRQPKSIATELIRQAGQYALLMRLDKPIGIWLLLWPTLWGLWIAAKGQPDPKIFLVFVLGVITMRSAGCVINDFADRKIDPKVARTGARPLAAGTVSPADALILFFALGLIAIALVLTLDPLTQRLAIVGAILTIIYPFTKRFFSAPQLVLGAAFGWGIPMAFAAQTGNIPRLAWLMWLTVVVWAVIYDTMYAMVDRADDLKAGMKSTAILFGSADVFIVTLLQVILVLALALMGAAAQLGGWYMAFLVIAAGLLVFQHILIRKRRPEQCFQAFTNHHYFGATIFAGIALDYLFKSGG